MNITSLSAAQLRKAADLKEQIASLETELSQLVGSPAKASAKPSKKKGGMSAAGRAAVAAAQKARWAKIKGAKAVKSIKKKNKMSAEGKARIAAAQKARWAKIKVAKK